MFDSIISSSDLLCISIDLHQIYIEFYYIGLHTVCLNCLLSYFLSFFLTVFLTVFLCYFPSLILSFFLPFFSLSLIFYGSVRRLSMPLHVQISADTGAVTLPIICHWFSKDLEGKYFLRTCVCVCFFFRYDVIFSFVIYIARSCVSHFLFVCSVLTFTISMNEFEILGAALATSTTSPSTSSSQTSDPLSSSSSSSVPSVSPHRQGSGTGTGMGNSLSQQTNTQSSIGNKNPLHVLVKYCEYVTHIAVVIVYNL